MKTEAKKRIKRMYRVRAIVTGSVFAIIGMFSLLVLGSLYIAEYYGYSLAQMQSPWLATFLLCLFCMMISAVAHYLVTRKVFNPLEALSDGSKVIAKGDFSLHLQYSGSIVELKTTIDNFNQMVRELSSVEMMRNDFIANVSHEFKTPLSSINGYVTLMQDPELSEEERSEYVQKIFFNIEKLNDLTANILRLSKLENQQYMDDPVQYRLDEQIREAVVMLEPKWGRKNIELDIDLSDALYTGQQQLLLQVWLNLIGNAIKFSDQDGKIAIRLRRVQSEIEIVIADNGIGMDEETLCHIFDKFYQGDTSRRGQGNGLGLAICKEILDRCGGTIGVESKVGEGTSFIVRLDG